MSNDQRPRRKVSNLVVDKGALLRLSIPFLIMAVVSIGIVMNISNRVMEALERTELVGLENLAAMNALHELQKQMTTMGQFGLVVLAVSCLILWIVSSHRIFGPVIPMRRHVRKLVEGDYTSRIHLRAGDEFKELSDDLNHLAEVLEKR
jgi:signal transduction histidine kinase